MLKAVDQSQHVGPADQSEHIVLFKRRGINQNVTDRLGREELQQCQICKKKKVFFNI